MLPKGFRPMKGDTAEIGDVTFPCLASPKIDGFRCIVGPDGIALSASLKPIPNKFVQDYFKRHSNVLTGLDGEIVVGPPNAPDVFEKTSGALRRKEGEPDFTFWVFDEYNRTYPYMMVTSLLARAESRQEFPDRVKGVHSAEVTDKWHLRTMARQHTSFGYEGTMVRSLGGPYKFGRSTKREGYLLKIKPFRDDEAVILGLVEQQTNNNPKTVDEQGLSRRSSHKANKVGANTLGGFRVRVLTGPFKGTETIVACGVLTKAEKEAIWCGSDAAWLGNVLTFKHMESAGGYEKPRHASFLRFRPDFDLPITNPLNQ